MSQNLSETQFHYVIKFVLTQQLLKSPHLLRESGDVVVTGSLHSIYKTVSSLKFSHFFCICTGVLGVDQLNRRQ